MSWTKLTGILTVVATVAAFIGVGYCRYFKSEHPGLQAYSRVFSGMTVDEVREVMGREEDPPDERKTTTGEFERSWTFECGMRYTVVFDKGGLSIYKELAPDWCGVTPLMGKYVED